MFFKFSIFKNRSKPSWGISTTPKFLLFIIPFCLVLRKYCFKATKDTINQYPYQKSYLKLPNTKKRLSPLRIAKRFSPKMNQQRQEKLGLQMNRIQLKYLVHLTDGLMILRKFPVYQRKNAPIMILVF